MVQATQQHTVEEAKAELLVAQKKKDDAMKEYLTIPPDGKPPNVEPPPEALTEAQLKAQEAEVVRKEEEKRMMEEQKHAPHPTQAPTAANTPHANVQKPKDDDDDDDKKPKVHGGGRR